VKEVGKDSKALVMGNGPSLNTVDFDILKKSDINTYATNRIANICRKNDWFPDYYCVFFAGPHQGSDLILPTGEIKSSYRHGNKKTGLGCQRDIKYVCENKETTCYAHTWYRYFLEESDNINFTTPTLWDRFKEFPMGIVDEFSAPENFLWWIATTSLFQLCDYHNIKNIGIIGIDGYGLELKENHYDGYEGSEPGNMKRSNRLIIRQHNVLKDYFDRNDIKVFNLSEKSILGHYPRTTFNKFLE
jgi:hypothetical protein